MSKLFLSLLLSFFMLYQTTLYADENSETPQVEDMQKSTPEPDILKDNDISEAQREADAAEAAELQESGVGEEPLTE